MKVQDDRVFVFVPHRSGSMLTHRIMSDLAKQAGRPHFSPNSDTPLLLRRICENPAELAGPGIYGPLRIAVVIPEIEDARIVVSLRDPRDVLVSMFFSYCFSHPGEIKGGTGYRAEVAARGIDDFVLRMATAEAFPLPADRSNGGDIWELAGNIRERHERLLALAARPNARLLRYEEMVGDFDAWLSALAAALGITDPSALAELARRHAKFTSAAGGEYEHRRHVQPGDHHAKLRPETIERLDEVFEPYFRQLRELQLAAAPQLLKYPINPKYLRERIRRKMQGIRRRIRLS